MTRPARALLAVLALLAAPAAAIAQSFPITLPPNTVYGRLGAVPGPGQAIPIPGLFAANLNITGNLTLAPTAGNALTINTAPGLGRGFNITQSVSGSTATYTPLNRILIQSDTASATTAAGILVGLDLADLVGPGDQGARTGLNVETRRIGASNAANALYQDVGIGAQCTGEANNNGTNTGAGAKGDCYAAYFAASLSNNATNWFTLQGTEIDIGIAAGSSSRFLEAFQISHLPTHAVQGAALDAAISLTDPVGPSVGWNYLIAVNLAAGQTPISTTGTVLGTVGAHTFANGIDMSSATITGSFLKSVGFTVSGAGVTTGTTLIANGNAAAASAPGANFQVVAADGQASASLFDTYTNTTGNNTIIGGLGIFRTANGTGTAPTALGSNALIGAFGGRVYTSAGAFTAANIARIAFTTVNAPSNTDTSSTITLETTPTGSTTRATALTVQPSGGVSVGTSTDPGIGAILANTSIKATTFLQSGAVAVGSLPTCNAGAKAQRYFVTDANATFTAGIGAVVAAGGANNVPVVCDGSNWRIG